METTSCHSALLHRLHMATLLIGEQRRPLAVFADNLSSRKGVTTEQSRNANRKTQNEEQTADRKRKNPLQLQDGQLAQELSHTSGCTSLAKPNSTKFPSRLTECQDRQRKAHSVVLVRRQEEHSIPDPSPDEHIGNNAPNEMRRVERNRANPIQRDEVPRQRASDSSNMDRARRGTVAEVREAQVEEVDDQQQLGEPEVRPHPEVDEAEEQQVGGDVVRADVRGCDQIRGVGGPQRIGVDQL
jgi:hypothetical protein